MIKIYISHASGFEKELYDVFRDVKGFDFILPHESRIRNSKPAIKSCDAMIADVSKPSHGVGIEIGWAENFGIPIILIAKRGSKISSSLMLISKPITYNKVTDILPKLKRKIEEVIK
ncbi:MAG TPA: hypothetical protein VJB05_01415 [archaeon]|nr:hypothetical protein [archaeon]